MNKLEILKVLSTKHMWEWEYRGYSLSEFYELMDEDMSFALTLDNKISVQLVEFTEDGVLLTEEFVIGENDDLLKEGDVLYGGEKWNN